MWQNILLLFPRKVSWASLSYLYFYPLKVWQGVYFWSWVLEPGFKLSMSCHFMVLGWDRRLSFPLFFFHSSFIDALRIKCHFMGLYIFEFWAIPQKSLFGEMGKVVIIVTIKLTFISKKGSCDSFFYFYLYPLKITQCSNFYSPCISGVLLTQNIVRTYCVTWMRDCRYKVCLSN